MLRGVAALSGMLVITALAPTGAQAAERLYGVTAKGRLVTFHSDSPGVLRTSRAITGLVGSDRITAIDVRPATGALYGVSSGSRLYTITPASGKATPVGGPFSPSLDSGGVGLDFNPVADKLRVVTRGGRNFRLGPVSGRTVDGDLVQSGVQGDRSLAYAPGDHPGTDRPQVTAIAYSNSVSGARATKLFGIDTARDTLVFQNPPDEGVLTTVGRLVADVAGPVGFDIASDGLAYASFAPGGRGATGLFRVNLSRGRAKSAAAINAIGGFARRSGEEIRALAAGGPVPGDDTRPRLRNRKLNNPRVSELLTGRVLKLRVSCSEACVAQAQLLLGRRVVGGARRGLAARGRRVLRLRLSRRGRRIVRRERPQLLEVGLAAVDAAGNSVRSARFQGR